MELPGLLFFSTYTLLVLFWAEIYYQVCLLIFCTSWYKASYNNRPISYSLTMNWYRQLFYDCKQARSLPIDKLRPAYYVINGLIYIIQVMKKYLNICSIVISIMQRQSYVMPWAPKIQIKKGFWPSLARLIP